MFGWFSRLRAWLGLARAESYGERFRKAMYEEDFIEMLLESLREDRLRQEIADFQFDPMPAVTDGSDTKQTRFGEDRFHVR